MSTKIYTWKDGSTNILCDKCADHMFITLTDRIVRKNMHLTASEIDDLESLRELELMDADAVDCKFPCQPINKNQIGEPECISTRFNPF